MKKLLVVLSILCSFALGAAGLNFTTGGDKPWTQKDGVWTSGDLLALGTGDYESWLELKVQAPCTVTFDLGQFARVKGSSGGFYSLISCYLDGEWQSLNGWMMNEYESTQITVPGSGERIIRWSHSIGSGMCDIVSSYTDTRIANVQVIPAPKTVTVTFDANGGSGGSGQATFNTAGTYGTLPEPTRTGCEFGGWFTAKFGGEQIREEDYVRFDCTKVYARWTIPFFDALVKDGEIELAPLESELEWYVWPYTYGWYAQPDESHDGTGAAASGGNGSLYATVQNAGTISFWWKTSGCSCEFMEEVPDGPYSSQNVRRASLNPEWTIDPETLMSVLAEGKWKFVTVDIAGEGAHELIWSAYPYSDVAAPAAFLDELSWTPAPKSMTVKCTTAKGTSSAVTCHPGDKFSALQEPARTGYVFGGWFYDTEFTKEAKADDLIPFKGATVYAKWFRTLASAESALKFRNNPQASEWVQYGDKAEDWLLVERTYTEGYDVMQASVGRAWSQGENGYSGYAVLETTVTGSVFLDFVWNMSYGNGFGSLALYVDGEEVRDYSASYEEMTSGKPPVKSERVVLDKGTHTVRWEATGNGAVATVGEITTNEITPAKTFGEWMARLHDLNFWTTGNLAALKSKYEAAKKTGTTAERYKAAIEHAFATVFALGEDKLVADTFKQFGFTLNYLDFGAKGAFDYSKAPVLNTFAESAVSKAKPVIEAALADLDLIPSTWTGSVTLRADEYPLDNDVTVDCGDVLYLKSLLKAALGTAYWIRAYNVSVDWKKLDADAQAPKVKTVSAAPTLASTANWGAAVDLHNGALTSNDFSKAFVSVQLAKGGLGEVGAFRSAWYKNKLYLRIDKSEVMDFDLDDCDSFGLEVHLTGGTISNQKGGRIECSYIPQGIEVGTASGSSGEKVHWLGWVDMANEEVDLLPSAFEVSENANVIMLSIDLTGTAFAKDTSLRYLEELEVWFSRALGKNASLGGWVDFDNTVKRMPVAALKQFTVLDKVRSTGSLSTSRKLVLEALKLAQSADDFIVNRRTATGDCLFNYDDKDAEGVRTMRANLFAAIHQNAAAAVASMSSAKDIRWKDSFTDEQARKMDFLDNPLNVYLGALFNGKINLQMLPQSIRDDAFAPDIDSMPDPTFDGLLPKMTYAKWAEKAKAQGMPYRNTGRKTYTLAPGESAGIATGLKGYAAKGLPSGLKYDSKSGKITGSASKPTAAKGVEVTFTKSGAATVRATFVVTAIPKIAVTMEGDTAKCKVTGAGSYLVGKKVTLKATAPKGTAFVGYFRDGEPWPDKDDFQKTSLSYVMEKEDVSLVAKFEKEKMSVGCKGLASGSLIAGVAGASDGIPLEIETKSGVKSVSVSKLPAGMKYDSKSGKITGAPTKSGTYEVQIKVTAKSGAVETKTVKVTVAAPASIAVGTFGGFVLKDGGNFGTFQLTSAETGKLTAKVVTASGSYSFTASNWDAVSGGVYSASFKDKKGNALKVALDTDARWDTDQMTGTYQPKGGKALAVSAQCNAFGKAWYLKASGSESSGWTFAYAATSKEAALTVTLKADGSTLVAGKLGSYKVSGSGYVNLGGVTSGALMADFAPIVKVKSKKTALSINVNLWFDRSDKHEEGVGTARFVK